MIEWICKILWYFRIFIMKNTRTGWQDFNILSSCKWANTACWKVSNKSFGFIFNLTGSSNERHQTGSEIKLLRQSKTEVAKRVSELVVISKIALYIRNSQVWRKEKNAFSPLREIYIFAPWKILCNKYSTRQLDVPRLFQELNDKTDPVPELILNLQDSFFIKSHSHNPFHLCHYFLYISKFTVTPGSFLRWHKIYQFPLLLYCNYTLRTICKFYLYQAIYVYVIIFVDYWYISEPCIQDQR